MTFLESLSPSDGKYGLYLVRANVTDTFHLHPRNLTTYKIVCPIGTQECLLRHFTQAQAIYLTILCRRKHSTGILRNNNASGVCRA